MALRSPISLAIILREMADRGITDPTRKRLWWHGGDRCAFPGCEQPLVESTRDAAGDTIVGKECHIIAQRDSVRVARSASLLSEEERQESAGLIEHRHSFENLVLMCGVHSDVIDDPQQGYSVADVLGMKRAHEETIARERQQAAASRVAATEGDAVSLVVAPPQLFMLADVPDWPRKALRQLREEEPEALEWLVSQIGDLERLDGDRVVELIDRWPVQLGEGSASAVFAVARIAEGIGRWSAAADVWERLADRYEGPMQADRLVRAAIDAGVGGDAERREMLLGTAERLDPDSPRLRLERLDDTMPPVEQLEVLGGIHSDDPALASLIAAHQARAALLLPDLNAAERHLKRARELEPDSLQVRSMEVNLRVQRARVALHDDEAFSLTEALEAMDEALDLREAMAAMGRWEESGRLLMLAADVPSLLRDPQRAEQLLELAREEEIEAPDGAEVLGDAALRAGADQLAVRFTENAARSDAVRRIRATAQIASPRDREDALQTLRDLALAGGTEAEYAAFARLSACLPPVRAPWDEEVAQIMDADPRARVRRVVTSVRIMALAASGEVMQAAELTTDLPSEPWAAELRLRVAGEDGDVEQLGDAALDFLSYNPDASGRLLSAMALARANHLDRATEVLGGIAHDVNAPPIVRSDAFATLMRALADQEQWDRATREWEAWQALSVRVLEQPDGRVSAWQVRIAHRASRRG